MIVNVKTTIQTLIYYKIDNNTSNLKRIMSFILHPTSKLCTDIIQVILAIYNNNDMLILLNIMAILFSQSSLTSRLHMTEKNHVNYYGIYWLTMTKTFYSHGFNIMFSDRFIQQSHKNIESFVVSLFINSIFGKN